jgi:hypothetical protein
LSDGGGVGLNLAMGSINLSGLEDSNVNGIVELPFYKEGHHFIEIFFSKLAVPGLRSIFQGGLFIDIRRFPC